MEKQSKGPLTSAGKTGGKQYGSAAGRQAGASFKGQFQKNLKGLAGPVTAAFAGLSAKKLLGDSVKAFTDLNLQVVQFRRLTGGSVEAASQLRTAVQLSGVDVAKATASLTIFSKNLGKAATDEKKAAATTALLGTSFVDANGQVESLTTLLPRVADKFAAMEDGVNKTTLATTLFGRAGVAMIPFLNKGAAGIADLVAQSDKLGLTLSQADLDAFGEYRTASRELSASFQGLKVEAGRELLPTLTSLTTFTTENAIPALKDLGSGARGAYEAYKALPGPIKDAAKAFIVLRVASAIGLTSAVTAGAASAAAAMTNLRLRTMFAGDAFRAQAASSGVLTASLAGVRAGAAGTSVALRSLAVSAAPIAAVTAGIAIFSKFQASQAASKSRVDALTASLDKQTGAITEGTREAVYNILNSTEEKDYTAIQAAKNLKLSLDLVADAALGKADALREVNQVIKEAQNGENGRDSLSEFGAAKRLNEVLNDQGSELNQARTAWEDHRAVVGKSTDVTVAATVETKKYSTDLDSARYALQKLINKEQERVDLAAGRLGDRLGIQQALADANKDLKFTKPGFNLDLEGRDQKSRDRLNALKDIATTFNSADPKVRNTPGLYEDVRKEFERLAIKAGASKTEVKTLRDQLLLVPKTATTEFRTPGLRQAQAEVDRLLASYDKMNANPQSLVPLYRADRADAPKATAPTATPRGRGSSGGGPDAVYMFNGNVTYTDEEQGRRRAKQFDRRATGDGVRRK